MKARKRAARMARRAARALGRRGWALGRDWLVQPFWAWREANRAYEVRRASIDYGAKRAPGPLPERSTPVRVLPQCEYATVVGNHHFLFTCHRFDDPLEMARLAALTRYGDLAEHWPITRLQANNSAAAVVLPTVLYPEHS